MASYKVISEHLSVRTSPGVTSQVIVVIPENTIVEGIRRSTDRKWMEVRLEDGQTGWCSLNYLIAVTE